MKSSRVAPKGGIDSVVRKASRTTKVMDAGLSILFAYLAYRSVDVTWRWVWIASSLFCLTTVFFSPMEWMMRKVQKRVYVKKS